MPVISHVKYYRNAHKNKPMIILATGPSSDKFMGEDLSRLPVMGINDSTKYWHTPYYMALDRQYTISAQQYRKDMVVFAYNHFHSFWRT